MREEILFVPRSNIYPHFMLLRLEVQVTPPPSFIRYEVPNDRLPKLLRRPSIRQLGSPSCQYDFAQLLTSLVEFQTARQGARQQRLTHIPHDPLVPPHHTAKYAPAQPSPGSSNHLTRISPLLVGLYSSLFEPPPSRGLPNL